jgi:hypothetical protein
MRPGPPARRRYPPRRVGLKNLGCRWLSPHGAAPGSSNIPPWSPCARRSAPFLLLSLVSFKPEPDANPAPPPEDTSEIDVYFNPKPFEVRCVILLLPWLTHSVFLVPMPMAAPSLLHFSCARARLQSCRERPARSPSSARSTLWPRATPLSRAPSMAAGRAPPSRGPCSQQTTPCANALLLLLGGYSMKCLTKGLKYLSALAFCPGTGNLSWVYQKYLFTIAVGFPLKLSSIVLVMLVLKSVVAAALIPQPQHIITVTVTIKKINVIE